MRARGELVLVLAGVAAIATCFAASHTRAAAAAAQVWPAFALVVGLLCIGIVANDDGLFEVVGERLGRAAGNDVALVVGASVLIGVVTAVLNLDTSVVFLTPVLVYTARSRGADEAPLLYASIFLANAGSLFLPGSNLTNLIVLGPAGIRGTSFLATMWPTALVALGSATLVLIAVERGHLRGHSKPTIATTEPLSGWLGVAAVALATACILVLRSPALPVLGIGLASCALHVTRGTRRTLEVARAVGVPFVVALFGAAVALGVVGRVWSGPHALLEHASPWAAAGIAALLSVLVNNLPAASLLSAGHLRDPFAVLVGLNLGPNLFVTGSLAWYVWLRSAHAVGARVSIARCVRYGLLIVPVSMAASCGVLVLTTR